MADVKGTLRWSPATAVRRARRRWPRRWRDARLTGPRARSTSGAVALAVVAPLALAGLWPARAAALSGLAVLAGLLRRLPADGRRRRSRWPACSPSSAGAARPRARRRPGAPRSSAYLPLAVDQPGGRTFGRSCWPPGAGGGRRGGAGGCGSSGAGAGPPSSRPPQSTLEHLARGERARIARELHDVVAHHVSLIALQADAARLTTPGMPAEGAKRLLAIGDTARTALTEMRRLLGVLREDADAPTCQPRSPQPGLDQLTDLLDDVRDAGRGGDRG